VNAKPVAITAGEPAGIGPDLCALMAREVFARQLLILGDKDLIAERAARRGVSIAGLAIEHHALAKPAQPGTLDAANAVQVIGLIDRAADGCRAGEFAAMVTAPVHKAVLNAARVGGRGFLGHTEHIAERAGVKRVVMMLAGGGMRVALATTHLALRAVPDAINRASLVETLSIVADDLRTKFAIAHPRILVCGLNPHAGEGGHLGREEIDTIAPAVEAARAKGIDAIGPMPADTLFTRPHLEKADAVLAMYHDQGLAPLKYASFGHGVNITLGLPIIRTSVDHGTALDKAADGAPIDAGSMKAAVALALELSARAA
jgi:4-hydroxythreonine-4-phosphate dehydrogenase